MISGQDVRELIGYAAKSGGVLSVYLNVDQSQAVNLNRGFEAALKNLLRNLEDKLEEKEQTKDFSSACERVLKAVANYSPHGRSLVAFANPERVFWQRELRIAVENHVRWSARPYARPLLEAFNEFRRQGVVLIDKSHARLFTVFLDQIEEHIDALAAEEVKHIKSPGSDHMRSQMQVQRKAEGHVRHHLKNVAELLGRIAEENQFERLILAGPVDATSELQGLLPAHLRRLVVGSLPLPMDASASEILEGVRKTQNEADRAEEEHLVGDLITAAAKNNQAVTGLDPTLRTVYEGRVWRIVYADGYAPKGCECTHCGCLFAESLEACPYCQGSVQPVRDVVARAASRVVNNGGKVEQVRDNAARLLARAGGVGAFLRF
jgi:peptide chain release factor subunit 1